MSTGPWGTHNLVQEIIVLKLMETNVLDSFSMTLLLFAICKKVSVGFFGWDPRWGEYHIIMFVDRTSSERQRGLMAEISGPRIRLPGLELSSIIAWPP